VAYERELFAQIRGLEQNITISGNAGGQNLITRLKTLYELWLQLMEAKKKFISLGWHSRHNHTSLDDDGTLEPELLVDFAAENGVTVLYITGHHSLAGSLQAMEYVRRRQDLILEIRPALEIHAPMEFTLSDGSIRRADMEWKIILPEDAAKVAEFQDFLKQTNERLTAAFVWLYEDFLERAGDWLLNNQSFEAWIDDNYGTIVSFVAAMGEKELLEGMTPDNLILTYQRIFRGLFNRLSAEGGLNKLLPARLNAVRDMSQSWTGPAFGWGHRERRYMRALLHFIYRYAPQAEIADVSVGMGEEVLRKSDELGLVIYKSHLAWDLVRAGIPYDIFADKLVV
jgi:hypothetical protein